MHPLQEVIAPTAPQIIAETIVMARSKHNPARRRGWGACTSCDCSNFTSSNAGQNLCDCGHPFDSHT
jgi:hypothetical protein